MIKKIQIAILLILAPQVLFSQRISLGATYSNTDAFYLKSIPGVTLGYEHQIWKFNLFGTANMSCRDYSYTESAGWPYESILIGSGEIFKGGLNMGASYNLISSGHYQISFGTYLGITYLHRVENNKFITYSANDPADIFIQTMDEWYKNRLGWGVSLEIEVMQVMLDQLSLFSRIEAGQTRLKDEIIEGLPFSVNGYDFLSFSFGLKYIPGSKKASL